MKDQLNVMSKFLFLGLSVDQVIERVTANSAKMFAYPEKIGSLVEGSIADVAVFEIQSGDFEFQDTRRTKRTGHQRFVPVHAFRAGKESL